MRTKKLCVLPARNTMQERCKFCKFHRNWLRLILNSSCPFMVLSYNMTDNKYDFLIGNLWRSWKRQMCKGWCKLLQVWVQSWIWWKILWEVSSKSILIYNPNIHYILVSGLACWYITTLLLTERWPFFVELWRWHVQTEWEMCTLFHVSRKVFRRMWKRREMWS